MHPRPLQDQGLILGPEEREKIIKKEDLTRMIDHHHMKKGNYIIIYVFLMYRSRSHSEKNKKERDNSVNKKKYRNRSRSLTPKKEVDDDKLEQVDLNVNF